MYRVEHVPMYKNTCDRHGTFNPITRKSIWMYILTHSHQAMCRPLASPHQLCVDLHVEELWDASNTADLR